MKIYKKIISFYDEINGDTNHRYKSWEHCYSYFGFKNIDSDIACLHLAFYLASWGMYRGSSSLLWKDYLIHKGIVEKLKEKKYLRKDYWNEKKIKEIIELGIWIKNYYKSKIAKVNGRRKTYNPSDVLVTKILLGTLGCAPAFDRYFISGMKKEKMRPKIFNVKSLSAAYQFYLKNKKGFDRAQKHIKKISGLQYPPMKLVDMYLWQTGYKMSK